MLSYELKIEFSSSRCALTFASSPAHITGVIIANEERLKTFLCLYKKFVNYQQNLLTRINSSVKHYHENKLINKTTLPTNFIVKINFVDKFEFKLSTKNIC